MAIYTQMKVLSASDILYARARDQIEQALTDEEIVVPDGVPDSQFLPTPGEGDNPDYLDPEAVSSAFTGAASGGSGPVSDADCQGDGETHGLGLVDGGSTLQPSGTALTNGGAVTAPPGDDAIDVAVQNQGTADESGIDVTVSSDDGSIDSTETISTHRRRRDRDRLDPARQPSRKAGESLTLNVSVTPVGCEQVEDNNEASLPGHVLTALELAVFSAARGRAQLDRGDRRPRRRRDRPGARLVLCADLAMRLRRIRGEQRAGARRAHRTDLVEHAAGLAGRSTPCTGDSRPRPARCNERLAAAEHRLDGSISKTAVIRYDAFSRGIRAAVEPVALLDDRDTGVVFSAILQREQARVYAKPVLDGRSPLDLSPEELEAMEQARRGEPAEPAG